MLPQKVNMHTPSHLNLHDEDELSTEIFTANGVPIYFFEDSLHVYCPEFMENQHVVPPPPPPAPLHSTSKTAGSVWCKL